LRLLRRNPGFAAVSVLTLAVGIGASVAVASAAYSVLYRPLPVPAVERLVVPVSVNIPRDIQRGSIPYADYSDWREQRDIFDGVSLFTNLQGDIAGEGAPERVQGLQVTEEYFRVIEPTPLAGRVLTPPDFSPDAPRVVVISESLSNRRFGGASAAVGRELRVAGTVYQIVGVVPAERTWPDEQDLWVPLQSWLLNDDVRTRRDNMIFLSIARLRTDVELAEGRARVSAIAARVAQEHPESRKEWTSDLIPLREYIVEPEIRKGMFVLLGGVGLLLLIACVNLANLLLARGADRAREVAVRAALGASRRRLVRQMLTESLVLALAGGAAGLLAARWLLAALKASAPPDLPMADTMAIDGVAFAVASILSLVAAVLFGSVPAISVSAFAPTDTLREGGRGGQSGRRANRLRDTLVVAQMALAIVLLVGAGLMLRTLEHLMRLDPGVDVERILAGRIALPSARYRPPDRVQFYERLVEALRSSPGVEAVAVTSYLPAGGRGFGLGRVFLLEGQPEPPASSDHPASWNVVSPDYFRTLGIELVRGRTFTHQDRADSTPVMIINRTMARRVFGEADPLGRKLRSWRDENVLREIVGVVSDVRYNGLADEDRSLVYVPHQQNAWGSMTIAVRAQSDPAAIAESLRREVARLDREVAVARIRPLAAMAADSIAAQRFGAVLLGVFAFAAALLAGIGVYGVMSYAVANRRHEFGVRLALGAAPRDLFRMIVRRGLLLATGGAAIGLAAGAALAPVMRGLISGVTPFDRATLATVPLVLLLVAVIACAVPGHRAARTEPLEAIRE
jgi:putative ABC transport system permease protein